MHSAIRSAKSCAALVVLRVSFSVPATRSRRHRKNTSFRSEVSLKFFSMHSIASETFITAVSSFHPCLGRIRVFMSNALETSASVCGFTSVRKTIEPRKNVWRTSCGNMRTINGSRRMIGAISGISVQMNMLTRARSRARAQPRARARARPR